MEILSYGGGTQTVAIIALIISARLSTPNKIIMADTGRERQSTFDYLFEIIQPALHKINMTVEVARHNLSTVDLYSGNGDLLIPVYTQTGKLPTFCSTEWKERVVQRYLRSVGVKECNCWIGYSEDEKERANRPSRLKWYTRRYPLLEMGLTRADCKVIINEMGWPQPPKSTCWMCPNQDDESWLDIKMNYPSDFAKAIELEKEIQQDDQVWLHDDRSPLAAIEFNPSRIKKKSGAYQCSFGCFI